MRQAFRFLCVLLIGIFFQHPSLYALEAKSPISSPQRISLDYKNAELTDVLKAISYSYNLNIVITKDISGKVSAQLKDITVDDALHAILSVNNYSYIRKGDVFYVQHKDDMDQVTETLDLHYLNLSEARGLLSGALTNFKGVIQENKDTNALVVTANPLDLDKIKECLRNIDLPPIQVLIQAQIIDISKSDLEKIDAAAAIQYTAGRFGGEFVKYSPSVTSTTSSSTSIEDGATANPIPFQGLVSDNQSGIGLSNTSNNIFSQGSLNALIEKNKARVIASPSIATLNGKEASIIIGEKFPYISSTASTSTNGGVTQTATTYVDVGTKLRVTPRVSPDGWITMKIQPEVSSVLKIINGNPDIATRSADTEVRVRDNETIVIGGLKSKSELSDKAGTPFLKDIPLIGFLFQSRNTSLVDGELTVLITPHIIHMPQKTPDKKLADTYSKTVGGDDNKLIGNILTYVESLEGDKSKDFSKNLYLQKEQIKSYRMILEQFPRSGKSDYCLYKIAVIYAKEFNDCHAARESLLEMLEVAPKSPYIPVTESLVDACIAVNSR